MVRMGIWPRTKLVFSEIKEGMKLKELYMTTIFVTFLGTVVPSFGTYLYYYEMIELGFSQWQYSTIQIVGFVTTIIGAALYSFLFSKMEYYKVTVLACVVNSVGALLTMLLCLNFTFGIPPFAFVMVTSTVTDVLYMVFAFMPMLVLYAKLIPDKIEASVFALLMGLSNLSKLFLAQNLGNLINLWVGCNTDTLATTTWRLYAWQSGLSLLPLFLVWMIPKRAQIEKVQRCFNYIEGYIKLNELEQQDSEERVALAVKLTEQFSTLSP